MSRTKDHEIILKCTVRGVKQVSKEIVGLGNGAPMITVSNQACFAKMSGCGLQEVIFRKGGEDFTYESTVRGNSEGQRLRKEIFMIK
jgi:hypothetical protein